MKNKIEKVKKTKGVPDDVDRHVGNRLRVRRSLLGYSQEKLAESVGVTFQQIQKYERGANRISASRLLTFSKILDIPINYFYEGVEQGSKASSKNYGFAEDAQESFVSAGKKISDNSILNQKETLELLKAYYAVQDPKVRKEMLKIVKSMAKNMS